MTGPKSTHGATSGESLYCRHDNRLVAECPRAHCLSTCPLRHECPAGVTAAPGEPDRRLAAG